MVSEPEPTTAEDRDGFKFRAGRLALDLPATLAKRLKDEPVDLLASPGDLARWLWSAGIAPPRLAVTDEPLREARALREALYRLAMACVHGEPFAAKDRTVVNELAARPTPAPTLGPNHSIVWSAVTPASALAVVARDGVELLGGPLASVIRECANPTCALLFTDQSRAQHRRWCSMAGCGNKAKVAEFRRRERKVTARRRR